MSSFEQLAARTDVGCLYYFDISTDKGVTFTKAYSTVWSFGGTYQTEPRIIRLGNLTRELGADRGFVAATIDVTLDNSDGGVDWACNQATFQTQGIQSIWKFFVQLWDPKNPSDYASKLIGVFSMMDPPTRKAATVEVTLVDGGIGLVSQLAAVPTLRDWIRATDAARPATLTEANIDDPSQPGYVKDFDPDAPLPLVFGEQYITPKRCFQNYYIICAVPGAAGVLPTAASIYLSTGDQIPSRINSVGGTGVGATQTVWAITRSATITKNGKSWHLIWLNLDLNNDAGAASGPGSGDPSAQRGFLKHFYADALAAHTVIDVGKIFSTYAIHKVVAPITVQGLLGSHNANDMLYGSLMTAGQIAYDILTTCLPTALTPENYTSTIAARPGTLASGTINQTFESAQTINGAKLLEVVDGDARRVLQKLCTAGQFDLFFTWAGVPRFSATAADSTALAAAFGATLPSLAPELVGEVTERIPSIGERHAPANRTYVRRDGRRFGPIEDAAAVAAWGRYLSREVDGEWLNAVDNTGSPSRNALYQQAAGQAEIRPVLSVVTGINGLMYELCDYITFTWSRGAIGGPYLDAIFRVESISLAPFDGKVQLQLVWCDDLKAVGNLPYILDDEANALKVSASGGRTCTLTTGSITVNFSSGDLGADGVLQGDVLVVQDGGEAATSFKRNRSLIIINVTSATSLEVDVTDFGTGGPFTISTWKIVRGPDTNPRPDYYGSTCTVLGKFYGYTDANRLLDG